MKMTRKKVRLNFKKLFGPCHLYFTITFHAMSDKPIILYFKNHTVGMIVDPILQPRLQEYAFSMNVSKVNNHVIIPLITKRISFDLFFFLSFCQFFFLIFISCVCMCIYRCVYVTSFVFLGG